MMENAFYFMLKALFILVIFTFLSRLFDYVEKRIDKKAKINLKLYDVTDWIMKNYNTYSTQYLNKQMTPDNKSWSVNRRCEIFFLKNHLQNVWDRVVLHTFMKNQISVCL